MVRKDSLTILAFLTLSLLVARDAAACKVDDPEFRNYYRFSDQEGNFNDFGRIHADADTGSSNCRQKAAEVLESKLRTSPDSEFNEWLRGAHVALIFAAAQRLGANGYLSQDLNTQLRRIEQIYVGQKETGCGKEQGNNTCADDYAIAASGHAWIAAYKYRRSDSASSVQSQRQKAYNQINNFFSEQCIHKKNVNEATLCNGTVNDLMAGTAETLSFNHGGQMPSYGFGLMTSIASAVLGINAAGQPFGFGHDNEEIAYALMQEMQDHVDAADQFESNCYTLTRPNGIVALTPGRACGGPDGYKPRMYALHEFYRRKLWGSPNDNVAGIYQSTIFSTQLFDLSSYANGFFSFSRHETYGKHGYSWWMSTPEWMPFDRYNPKGYLEQIGPTGVAQGWTCDPDAPKKSNRVRVAANGGTVVDESDDVRADSGSEQAIKTECGDGNYHRFWYQLPSWTKGKTITAFGLDYTSVGETELYCLQPGGCRW